MENPSGPFLESLPSALCLGCNNPQAADSTQGSGYLPIPALPLFPSDSRPLGILSRSRPVKIIIPRLSEAVGTKIRLVR